MNQLQNQIYSMDEEEYYKSNGYTWNEDEETYVHFGTRFDMTHKQLSESERALLDVFKNDCGV